MTDPQTIDADPAAFSADGIHHTRVAALRRLPVRRLVLLAADWSEAVLPVWEEAYPADHRPRLAIEAARAGDGDVAAAYAGAYAAYAAAWDDVRRLWDAAYNAGNVWRPEWRTPLAVETARDPADYPVLLDLLEDAGAPVEGLRAAWWARSNWAIYHLTEGKL